MARKLTFWKKWELEINPEVLRKLNWTKILGNAIAYGIPLLLLLYVLYWNWLPFGYEKTYVLDVGAESDLAGEFRLVEGPGLGPREEINGTTFRRVDGVAYAIFEPKAILRNTIVKATLIGENVSFIMPPIIEEWDYEWDFSKGVPPEFEIVNANNEFPQVFDGCLFFDGNTQLVLPNSSGNFDEGPFVVHVKWITEKTVDNQQLIGHYNWEIFQDNKTVRFRIGNMEQGGNVRYTISHQTDESDSNKHSLIAIYQPSIGENDDGYIELYVDNNFVERRSFGNDTLDRNYTRDLSIGQTLHGVGRNNFFKGAICEIRFTRTTAKPQRTQNISFVFNIILQVPMLGDGEMQGMYLIIG